MLYRINARMRFVHIRFSSEQFYTQRRAILYIVFNFEQTRAREYLNVIDTGRFHVPSPPTEAPEDTPPTAAGWCLSCVKYASAWRIRPPIVNSKNPE
jgi:hypothetical protein